jgi:hypothetical protein
MTGARSLPRHAPKMRFGLPVVPPERRPSAKSHAGIPRQICLAAFDGIDNGSRQKGGFEKDGDAGQGA